MAAKLKKGDKVVVLTGKDKGKEGEILKVLPDAGRALVGGINLVTRHVRSSPQAEGGRVSQEASINLSNLAYLDPKEGGPTRVGFKDVDGKKVRFAKKSGEIIDA
jgi:large subunit ribosomal protein L24